MFSFNKLLFSFFIITFSYNYLFSQDIIVNNKFSTEKYIGKKVRIYQDTSKDLTFNYIIKSSKLFHSNNSDVITFGLSNYYNWISFTLVNKSNEENLILNLEYPIIDNVTLYLIYKDNKIDSMQLSESFSKSKRLFNSQFYLFPIKLKKNEFVNCYIKLFSYKPILVPLSISNTENTITNIDNIDIFSGIYVGIMLVMFLYNFFIYYTTKDNSYLYYVIYIAGVTITQLTLLGYSNKYIWPDYPLLTQKAVPLVGAISGIVVFIFTDKFLDTKKTLFTFHIILRILILVDVICILILLLGYNILSYHIIDANAGIGSLVIFLTVTILVIKGYKAAKFFLTGWIVFLIAIVLYVMKDYGILPYNNFTIHSLQFGSAIEAVLLSFALADKINTYKKEKEELQAQALVTAQEKVESAKNQNNILEHKVEERTFELVETNKNLNKTLTDLKEAQTQLVEAEKMASLGQLTAGIAHEINNPINFVSANIEPLKRDVDLLVDAIQTMENVGLSEIPVSKKQQQIDEYKEEIDFDYLKLEIGQLLNGIHEGASRTAEIVKGLKIFARLDEDDLKKADINEGLASTLLVANNIIGKNIRVIRNFGQIPVIECFPGKLNQVFLNIISNAIYAIDEKFGKEPGGVLELTTACDEKYLLITIADNGTGMSEATKNKIFEPFFTTKNVGVGTGLGMSIVYNTIKKHHGEIYINSAEGEGTTFILKLHLIFDEYLLEDYQSEQHG